MRNAKVVQSSAHEQKLRVHAYFESSESWQGTLYDDQSGRFNRAVYRRKQYAIEMLGDIPPEHRGSALDVGCGCGEYTSDLMEMGFETYATDISQHMLDACRERLKMSRGFFNRHFRRADIEALPFNDRSFDLVVSVGVLGYLLSDVKALSEVRRVLRPGGYFLVSVQNMNSLSNLDYLLRRRLRAAFSGRRSSSGSDKDSVSMEFPWVARNTPTHHFYKCYFPRRFERMMKRHGFWLIDAMTLGHEFRILRRYKLLPESLLTRCEIALERLFWRGRIPFLRYSGEAYTALFQLEESTPARPAAPHSHSPRNKETL
jgi:ubiquinone/menaquinone biosynthesis C-methylase UbiE